MESIYKRRSIRKYTDKPVEEALILKIIKAGMNAPSARNIMPWHFVVINERALLDTIPTFQQYSQMLLEAQCAILVCIDKELQPIEGYWGADGGAATQNMLLEIDNLGLGGVWLGIYPIEHRISGMSDLLNLPENIVPFSLISMGYADEHKEANNKYFQEKIHFNKW